ncbi:Gfo/Idh/MocA family protein [Jatrophihabitans fulvus]
MTHFVVIGLGSIGRRHAGNLAASHPDARFTFVRHRGGSDELSERLGARVVTDLDDVLGDDADLAILATPSANHVDVLPDLIDRGWRLLVEKPIVTSVADCDAIAARLAGAPPAVRVAGFNLRYLPALRAMREHVCRLGRVVRAGFVCGQWLPDWRPGTDYRESYSADVARGGGVELDLSHEFDVARWFFGDLDVDFARGGRFSGLDLRANDTSVSVLSPVGVAAPVVTVAVDYVARRRVRWYEVVGEHGRVEWNLDDGLRVYTDSTGPQVTEAPLQPDDITGTYVDMLAAVLSAGGPDDLGAAQSLTDGLASSRLSLQVRDLGSTS